MAQIYFRGKDEMKTRKPKNHEPSLIEQLSGPLRDFVNDFKTHGASVLQKVREDNPEKNLELSTKLLPLVVGLNPGADDFSDCTDTISLGIKLLKSVRAYEYNLDDGRITDAINAQAQITAQLHRIRAHTEAQIQCFRGSRRVQTPGATGIPSHGR